MVRKEIICYIAELRVISRREFIMNYKLLQRDMNEFTGLACYEYSFYDSLGHNSTKGLLTMSKLSKLFLLCTLLLLATGQAHAYPGQECVIRCRFCSSCGGWKLGDRCPNHECRRLYLCSPRKGWHQSWAAMPETEIKVGEEVALAPGAPMNNFNSRTLNRTFDTIYFTSRSGRALRIPV